MLPPKMIQLLMAAGSIRRIFSQDKRLFFRIDSDIP
jgi:hypothetical protein